MYENFPGFFLLVLICGLGCAFLALWTFISLPLYGSARKNLKRLTLFSGGLTFGIKESRPLSAYVVLKDCVVNGIAVGDLKVPALLANNVSFNSYELVALYLDGRTIAAYETEHILFGLKNTGPAVARARSGHLAKTFVVLSGQSQGVSATPS